MAKLSKLARRALTPMVVVRCYYFLKHRAVISSKAEMDLAGTCLSVTTTAWPPVLAVEPPAKTNKFDVD